MINDTIEVLTYATKKYPTTSFILVGHSMGGSIAAKTCERIFEHKSELSFAKQIQGLFIIDVVEGSALDALPFMENIAKSRP